MKFTTIDIEGDGLYRTLNQKLFPEGNHFDPGTVIWCVSFCDQGYNTTTYIKKLSDKPRLVKDGVYTKAVHYKDSIVPKDIEGHEIIEFTDTMKFINAIMMKIMMSPGYTYCKGYKGYNYDAMLLKSFCDRNNYYGDLAIEYVKPIEPSVWKETYNQIKTGNWIDNQTYMVNGIKHNIEDAIQLAQRINNKEIK